MAKLIATLSVGVILWTFAIFYLGGADEIDPETTDRELFNKLNDDEIKVEGVKRLLEEVDDKANVLLAGHSVSRLLDLKNNSNVDCRLDTLKKDCSVIDDYRGLDGNFNLGLIKFCKHHFIKRVNLCLDRLLENFDAEVEQKLNPTDRAVATEFWSWCLHPKTKLTRARRQPYYDFISAWNNWMRESNEEKKTKLRSSCSKLDDIQPKDALLETWTVYNRWLRGQTISFGWMDIAWACAIIKGFL